MENKNLVIDLICNIKSVVEFPELNILFMVDSFEPASNGRGFHYLKGRRITETLIVKSTQILGQKNAHTSQSFALYVAEAMETIESVQIKFHSDIKYIWYLTT